ncbi:hypothetical protein JCM5350_001311 [Sporobolomyces pararoseus]
MASTVVPRVDTHSTRVDVINTKQGRILCVADVRGALSTLNSLAAEHNAVAIIHSGDFGFYEPSSIPSISDRTLKHLIQYSSLISPQFRSQLLSPSTSPTQLRQLLTQNSSSSSDFALSEFPKFLSGELKFNVPIYTVWGACEDVQILEKIRIAAPSSLSVPSDPSSSDSVPPTTTTTSSPPVSSGDAPSYSIPNLTVLDEATTRVLNIGGIRLRLFGLGGAVVPHKLFDNGSGNATIAGGMGTMWTTMLQIGELVDTAQKKADQFILSDLSLSQVYDPTETRLLITHASPGREGLISQLSLVLKADLTISAGLHFRYGVSYNEFSVTWDPETFKNKLEASRKAFGEVWDAVKAQVEGIVDDNQKALLSNALAVANRVSAQAPVQGGPAAEETAWKNCWNWNLPDAAFGSLVLDIKEGRIGSEMKSQGFNFAYRSAPASSSAHPSSAPVPAPVSVPTRAPTGPGSQPQGSAPHQAGGGRPQSSQFQNRGFLPPHHQQRGPRGPGGSGFQQQQQQQTTAPASTVPASSSDSEKKEVAPPSSTQQPAAVNGSNSATSPSPATPTPPSTIPTGPRQPNNHHQNRPPSRSHFQQQQQQTPASNSTAASASTQPQAVKEESHSSTTEPSSAVPVTGKSSEDPSSGQTTREEGVTSPVGGATPHERTPGGGRGRGGRGRGSAGGSRGRSNGEWRGRGGRGGPRQGSNPGGAEGTTTTGGAGAGTPNAATAASSGGEKTSSA